MADSSIFARKIVQTTDGHIAVTGALRYRQNDPLAPIYEGALCKITAAGDVVWTLKLDAGPSLLLYIDDLVATSDGGMIVLTMTAPNYNSVYRSSLVKVSQDGAVEWTKTIDGQTYFYLNSIREVENGYLVTGLNSFAPGSIVFKTDFSGNLLWGKSFRNVKIMANAAAENTDGDLYLPGGLNVNNSQLVFNAKPLLLKMDTDGNLLWSKVYKDAFSENLSSPVSLTIDKCLLVQDSLLLFSNNFNAQDLIILKTDTDGHPAFEKRFKQAGGNSFFPVLNAFKAGNGEILVSTNWSTINDRPTMMSFSPALEMNWLKIYGTSGADEFTFEDMYQLDNDEGFLYTGALEKDGKQYLSVIKTDMDGEISGRCCAQEQPVFQGFTADVTAVDTSLILLNFPTFTDGTSYSQLVEAVLLPVCTPPVATISQSDTLICPGQCVIFQAQNAESGALYTWSFAGADPDTSAVPASPPVCYNLNGTYKIILRDAGCLMDTTELTVEKNPDQFPNAFSPNGDGVNEVYRPIGLCNVDDYRMQIFNRWGQRIFESKSANEGWNGEVAGSPAPPDVYICLVEYYTFVNGVRTMLSNEKKEVTLIR